MSLRVTLWLQSVRTLPCTIQFNSMQFNAIQCNSIQFSWVQFSSVQFNWIELNSIQFSSVQFISVQFSSVQFNLLFKTNCLEDIPDIRHNETVWLNCRPFKPEVKNFKTSFIFCIFYWILGMFYDIEWIFQHVQKEIFYKNNKKRGTEKNCNLLTQKFAAHYMNVIFLFAFVN